MKMVRPSNFGHFCRDTKFFDWFSFNSRQQYRNEELNENSSLEIRCQQVEPTRLWNIFLVLKIMTETLSIVITKAYE